MMEQNYQSIPKEKFRFVQKDEQIHDKRLETKAIGYFQDAWMRFRKNKGAVIAFALIVILALFAIIVPFVSQYTVTFRDGYYKTVLPKSQLFYNLGLGIWDGSRTERQS